LEITMRPLTRLLLVVLLTSSPVTAQSVGSDSVLVLTGARVIDPARDAPIDNATVVIVGRQIRAVTSGRAEYPSGARVLDLTGRTIVPGLIDAHVHLGDAAAARRALHSGVTTARSMGVSHFVDVGLRELAAQGVIDAPEIIAAGYHVRPRPSRALFLDQPTLADLYWSDVHGAEAVRRVADALLARGVDVIKTNATERAGLPDTDPRKTLYSETELRVLVEHAGKAGIGVAAHAHGDEGGRAAVLAGVRSIEHGTYLSPETLAIMAERGTYLVPTIAVVRDLTMPGGDYDNATLLLRGQHMLPRIRETATNAHRAGVRLVTATDTGYGPESVVRLSHELLEFVALGLSTLDAIRAASTVAADLLGVADHAGRVAVGFDADLVVLERDPLTDIGAYRDPLMVINNGKVALDRVGG
jgi:imidazolonepropionase-like amidohydrolase